MSTEHPPATAGPGSGRRRGPVVATLLTSLAAAGLGVATPLAAQEPRAAGALIDRVLDAYGGREALSAIRAYRAEGKVMTGHAEAAVRTTRLFALPCRLEVVLLYPDRTETRIVDGGQGWRSGADSSPSPARGPLLDSMRLQCARAALPWILDSHREAARLLEPGAILAEQVDGLEITLDEGLTLRAYVERDSGRVLRTLTILDHPQMKLVFETRYSDFRSVGGVLFPHREENYTGGQHTASTTLDRVDTDPEIGEGAFRP